MEELQLLLESKLYEPSQESLRDVGTFLNMGVVPDESRIKTTKRIQTEMEDQAKTAGEDSESFWLNLKRTIVEDMPPLEDDSGEEKEDSEGILKTAKEKLESMQKAFEEMLEIQKKKMDEAESKFLSLSTSKLPDKPATKTGAGATLAPQNIIRIKDFKISGTITNEKNRLPFSSLNKQIESSLQRGYSEPDIVDGVINSIAPNLHLRSYLENMSSFSLSQLRVILRSHYCEK